MHKVDIFVFISDVGTTVSNIFSANLIIYLRWHFRVISSKPNCRDKIRMVRKSIYV